MSIKYRELRKRFETDGADQTVRHLCEALESGDLKAEDFSIRELAEGLIPAGSRWLAELDPRHQGGSILLENGPVDASAFLNVAGQVVYSKILESYNQEVFAASKLVQTIPTRFDGEKLPGSTSLPDQSSVVEPGEAYPLVGFGEDFIETPSTTKRGLIVALTREAIFFDRTHVILARAAEVGETLALNKEKRILDTILGVTKSYNWKGTGYDTYYAGEETDPWKNLLSDNPLGDAGNIVNAEELLASMIDPATGEPVLIEPNAVLVMPSQRLQAHRLFHASQFVYDEGGLRATASNPFASYQIVSSRLALRRLIASGVTAGEASTCWILGNFAKAFAYMENWPITVTQSVGGSEADFSQDIVVRFKASERGTPAVLNPRYVVKSMQVADEG